MENGAFAPYGQMLHFHNIFKNLVFQRHQKALLWSNGLKPMESQDGPLYILLAFRI